MQHSASLALSPKREAQMSRPNTPIPALCAATLALALAACGPSTAPSASYARAFDEAGILSANACPPPCFLGIVPGSTTEAELTALLESAGLSQECTATTSGITCGNALYISVKSGTDIVQVIGFTPPATIYLEDVVSRYGMPSLVRVQEDATPQPLDSVALLFFYSISTRLTLPTVSGATYLIDSRSPIENIAYLSPTIYEEMTSAPVASWHGYGEYPQDWLNPP
jgi:hypothetical protein